MVPHFSDSILNRVHEQGTPCVVGLQPLLRLMPNTFLKTRELTGANGRIAKARALHAHCRLIINEVHDLVAAVVVHTACFHLYGWPGIQAMEETVQYARGRGLTVLLDIECAGSSSTSDSYVQAHLRKDSEGAQADAITASPYQGHHSLSPLFAATKSTGRGVFVSLKGASPDSALLQDLESRAGEKAWMSVANYLRSHSNVHLGTLGYSSIGAIIGAPHSEHAEELRALLPHNIFLIPGIGAQGGSIGELHAFFSSNGLGALVLNTRAINYPHQFAPIGKHGDGSVRGAALDFIAAVKDAVPASHL